MASRRIEDLHPDLQLICHEFLAQAANQNIDVLITCTWRSNIEQDIAKAKGLSNASAGQSPHDCCNADGSPNSKAFDFGIFDNGKYVTDGTDERYRKAGEIGESLGLVWGGSWNHPDWDHIELSNWKTLT